MFNICWMVSALQDLIIEGERERENNVVQDCDLLSVNWSLEKKSDHVGLVKFELVLKGLDKKRLRHD